MESFVLEEHSPVNPGDPLSGPLVEYLALACERDPETYFGFWLSIGTSLTRSEIEALRWEHFTEAQDGVIIRGFIGLNDTAVEAYLAPAAFDALRPFQKGEGPVLVGVAWPSALRILLHVSGAPSLEQLRSSLGARPARRTNPLQTVPAKHRVQPANRPGPAVQPSKGADPSIHPPRSLRALRRAGGLCIAVSEVAQHLGMSVRWVTDRVKAGELKGYRLGHRLQVDLESLEGFLKNRSVGAQDERGAS